MSNNRNFVLGLDYIGLNSYLFVNGVEVYRFKATDSEINIAPLCLGNVSKDFWAGNMNTIGLHRCAYGFSTD